MDDEITPAELAELLAGEDPPRVVDIRRPAAFRRGHLPGSVNVPFDELPERVAELAGADRVVTVCPHGEASVQAARLIGSYEGTADARVESLAGGLAAWTGPLETGDNGDAGGDDDEDSTPDAPF